MAERLFARHGYSAASIRKITRAAKVETALANYHFGSKSELLCAVIARRVDTIRSSLEAGLQTVLRAAGDEPPQARSIIEALVRPMIERRLSADWRNYIRIISHTTQIPGRADLIAPLADACGTPQP